MDKQLEAVAQAILDYMESDEAFALAGISSDEEFDKAMASGQAKAAIAALAGLQWQSIETAPKDGRLVLLGFKGGETGWYFDRTVARHIGGLSGWSAKGVSGLQPDYWMPLIELPAIDAARGE